jgi:hypothetical protein
MSREKMIETDDDIDILEDEDQGEHLELEEGSDDTRQVDSGQDDGGEDERESVRERRRQEKRERKQRQEEAKRRDKTELAFLQRRNEELERRFSQIEGKISQSEMSSLDSAIAEAQRRAQLAEQVFAKAITAKNGEDAAKAMQYRDQARAAAAQLSQQKQVQLYAAQQAQAQAQNQSQMPPAKQVEMAQEFIKEMSWYDPSGADEDSAIVLALDAALVNAGYDPNTEDYWDELRERVRRRLPEKFEQKQNTSRSDTGRTRETARPRGGPQIGSGRGDGGSPSGRREVYISPERKQAMIEAGVWDDPVLRNKYIKRYVDYDKQNSR